MARHLIMGYYTCNLGHKHSTDEEMKECNRMEEEKQIRDHTLTQQNIENERIVAIAKMKEQEIELERERMRHEEAVKLLELEKAKAEKDKQPPKSKVCVLS